MKKQMSGIKKLFMIMTGGLLFVLYVVSWIRISNGSQKVDPSLSHKSDAYKPGKYQHQRALSDCRSLVNQYNERLAANDTLDTLERQIKRQCEYELLIDEFSK